jgi:hypothetical protein
MATTCARWCASSWASRTWRSPTATKSCPSVRRRPAPSWRADDHLRLGNYAAAADDLDRAEKLDSAHYWPLIPFLRALCRARVGRVEEALADAARVPDDYLLPGFGSAIPNSKQQLAAAIEEARLQRESEQAS